jgi:hypothetical protein
MDKNSFGKIMSHPGTLSPDEWSELHRDRDRYPFSAPLQVVALLADKAAGAPMWEHQSLPVVSLYVQDVDRLYEQLDAVSRQPMEANHAPVSPVQPSPVQPPKEIPSVPVDFDILQEINAYQDVSFKTAPKSVILSNFLEKDGGIVPDFETYDDVPVQELAKNSIRPSQSFESETLAVILEKQGKLQQALEMYEKLLVKNPEKSSIFAVRISKLKSQLSS